MRNSKSLATVSLLTVLWSPLNARGEGDGYNPFRHAAIGLESSVERDNLLILGGGLALTLAARPLDRSYREATRSYPNSSILAKTADFWQHGFMAVGVIELSYGWFGKSDRSVQAGLALLEAAGIQALIELGLKYAINRPVPCNCVPPGSFPPNDKSFPSGQSSWVLVGNSMEFFGPEVWIPFMGLSLAGAWERSYKHWLSDIPFGIAMSLVLGRAFAKHHQQISTEPAPVSFLPLLGEENEAGLMVKIRL